MILIYIVFFVSLNYSIYVFLIKKTYDINRILVISSQIVFSLLFVYLHFYIFNENYVDNEKFLTLLCSSLVIVLFYFGSKIPLMTAKKIHGIDLEKNGVYLLFNFIRSYFIPVTITLVQIIMLFNL